MSDGNEAVVLFVTAVMIGVFASWLVVWLFF